MKSIVDMSVEAFALKHSNAVVSCMPNMDWSVLMQDAILDEAVWAKPLTNIAFVVPARFPLQHPDCFWTDADLRLKNGALPCNANMGSPHPMYPGMLWFSYHPQAWSASDTVETYWHLIQGRLLAGR
jgi:hypothetical protein